MPDGSEHVLHFKQLPASEFRKLITQAGGDAAAAGLQMIAACLCDADGASVLTIEDAARLTLSAEKALSEAAMEVNGLGKPAAA